jgi:hypothetical protein
MVVDTIMEGGITVGNITAAGITVEIMADAGNWSHMMLLASIEARAAVLVY